MQVGADTSSVHAVNGCIVFATSRGQKVVRLSSAACELHALVGGACDGVFSQVSDRRRSPTCLLDGQLSNKTVHVQKRKWKAEAHHQWKSFYGVKR